jgi:hypothetical protein
MPRAWAPMTKSRCPRNEARIRLRLACFGSGRQGRRVRLHERFYNARRRHSTIGYKSPMKFERQAGVA